MALRLSFSGAGLRFTLQEGLTSVRPGDLAADTPEEKAAFRTRLEVGTGGTGLNQAEVDARVQARVKSYAGVGGRQITLDDQISSVGNAVRGAVVAASVETTDDALTMQSSGGQSVTIEKTDLAIDTVSQEEAEAGTLNFARTFTPERVKQAIVALSATTQARVQELLGPYTISVTVSSGQLHIIRRDADGNEVTDTETLSGGSGATQAHTDDQIRNLAGALVAQTLPFTYNPTTHTLTYTQPLPADGSLTLAKLDQTAQDLINSKIASAMVEAAARVGAITDAQAQQFREKIGAASAASRASNPLEYEELLGQVNGPQSATTQWHKTGIRITASIDTITIVDEDGKVLVNTATNTRTSVRVSDILAQATVQDQQAASADGLRVVVRFPSNPSYSKGFDARLAAEAAPIFSLNCCA